MPTVGGASYRMDYSPDINMDEPQHQASTSCSQHPGVSATFECQNQVLNEAAHITSAPELRGRQADCGAVSQSASQAIQQASQSVQQASQQASQAIQQASQSASQAIQQVQQRASQSIAAASRTVSSVSSSANSAVSMIQASAASELFRASLAMQSVQLSASVAQVGVVS
jgi:hypothetical protein